MNRNPHFLVTGMQKLDVCGSEMLYLKGSAYEKPFPIKYYPIPEHNLENCKGCQKTHQQILKEVGDYFKDFPNCCNRHKNLQKHSLFKKEDFDGLAQIVADKVIYMHHHILNNLDQDNWEEEINNYLEYAVTSFGQTPENCGEPPALSWFMDYTKRMQLNHKLVGDDAKYKERQKKVIDNIENYYKPKSKGKKDFNLLLSTYDKWYKFFPFDIPLFAGLKKHYSRTLPILAEKPKTNPYLGTAKVELLSQSQLLKNLSNITNNILISIDTTKLLEDDYISNKTKYSFDLKKKSHSVKQASLLSKPTKNEKEYIKTIKAWLKNEKEFINDIKDDIVVPSNNKFIKSFNNSSENNLNHKQVVKSITKDIVEKINAINSFELILLPKSEKSSVKLSSKEIQSEYANYADIINTYIKEIYLDGDIEYLKRLLISINEYVAKWEKITVNDNFYLDIATRNEKYRHLAETIDVDYIIKTKLLFLTEIQNNLDQQILKIDSKKPKLKPKLKYQSFTYKKLKFESENLNDLRDSLKEHKLIAKDTSLSVFKKVFSGGKIEKPIIWIGNISELYYFINQLYVKLKLVEDLKQKQWEVTNNCFVKADGNQFGRYNFKGQQVPATSKSIDSALKTLK